MSDLQKIASGLRALTGDSSRVARTLRDILIRTLRFESELYRLSLYDVDVEDLAELLHSATQELTAAIDALDDLRVEGTRFANSLAFGDADGARSVREIVGDALIAAEATHLFLTPSVVPAPSDAITDSVEPPAITRLIEVASAQAKNTDDLQSLRESLDKTTLRRDSPPT